MNLNNPVEKFERNFLVETLENGLIPEPDQRLRSILETKGMIFNGVVDNGLHSIEWGPVGFVLSKEHSCKFVLVYQGQVIGGGLIQKNGYTPLRSSIEGVKVARIEEKQEEGLLTAHFTDRLTDERLGCVQVPRKKGFLGIGQESEEAHRHRFETECDRFLNERYYRTTFPDPSKT